MTWPASIQEIIEEFQEIEDQFEGISGNFLRYFF